MQLMANPRLRLFAGAEFMLGAVVITEEFVAEHRGFGVGALAALGSLGYAAAIGLYAPLDWLPEGYEGVVVPAVPGT